MLRHLIILTVLVLLSACAKPPHQELDAAQYMVSKAYAMQALEFAPAEYQAAHTALSDARRAMDKSDFSAARDSLDYALQHARRAITLSAEGQAKRTAEAAQKALEDAQVRQADQQKVQTEPPSPEVKPRPPAQKPVAKPKEPVRPAADYIVGDGENLWTISAHPEVYNEGLLWPLLYQANRDQIKDPRQIFQGQTLSIRRDMTEAELEEARQKARESDIFPVPETPAPPR